MAVTRGGKTPSSRGAKTPSRRGTKTAATRGQDTLKSTVAKDVDKKKKRVHFEDEIDKNGDSEDKESECEESKADSEEESESEPGTSHNSDEEESEEEVESEEDEELVDEEPESPPIIAMKKKSEKKDPKEHVAKPKNDPKEAVTKPKKDPKEPVTKPNKGKGKALTVKKIKSKSDSDEDEDHNVDDGDGEDDDVDDVEMIGAKPFYTRCRTHNLQALISKFTPDQVKSVNEIGFGGILKLRLTRIQTTMLPWLIENFDSGSWIQSVGVGKEYVVTPFDVYDVFGIPLNFGKNVIESKRVSEKSSPKKGNKGASKGKLGKGAKGSEKEDLKSKWRERFEVGKKDQIPVKLLEAKLASLTKGGDEFKRFFVAHVFSTLLSPSANRTIDLRIVESLEDVGQIRSYNWCKYMLERLSESVSNYKTYRHDCFSGCAIFLEIVYFHRLKFRGVEENSSLPLIQHWTDEKIRQRINMEREAKCFGMGVLDDKTYPVSKKMKFTNDHVVDKENGISSGAQEKEGFREDVNVTEHGLRVMKFVLPQSSPTDDELLQICTDDIHYVSLQMKRAVEAVTSFYSSHIQMLTRAAASKSSLSSSTNKQLLSNSAVHNVIDEIADVILAVKDMPEESSQPSHHKEKVHVPNSTLSKEVDIDNVISNVVRDVSLLYQGGDDYESVFKNVLVNGRSKCSVSVGAPCSDVTFVSSFMRSYGSVMKVMPKLHQEIADFCLLDDDEAPLLKEDVVWFDMSHSIPGDELVSLAGDQFIYQSIVEHWAILLNENQRSGPDKPRKFFFGVEQSKTLLDFYNQDEHSEEFETLLRCWSEWVDDTNKNFDLTEVKLVFVPILLSDHYFVLVCNLEKDCVQLLDNRIYSDEERTTIEYLSNVMCDALSAFLSARVNHVTPDISIYQMVTMELGWRSLTKNNDCAIYAMMHMLLFDGRLFDFNDLSKVRQRALMRAQICVTLVLSDANDKRDDILSKLQHFNANRDRLRKEVFDRKKNKVVKEKEAAREKNKEDAKKKDEKEKDAKEKEEALNKKKEEEVTKRKKSKEDVDGGKRKKGKKN